MKNILITGGTGLVGRNLIKLLEANNYRVAVLSRSTRSGNTKSFLWDYNKGTIDNEAIDFADVIIHLVGENVSSKKWTPQQKKKIVESRTLTTNLLYESLKQNNKRLEAFISASAVGIYGSRTSDKIFRETDSPANDFLAQTVVEWEKSVSNIAALNIPVAMLRLGVVMSQQGGALPKMLAPVKFGFGAALGTGKQWVPWIEINDLSRLFHFVIEKLLSTPGKNSIEIYNAVSPHHITNNHLMKQLSKALRKPFFFPPVPAFVFRLIYGEMAVILLEGSRVSAQKIIDEGFHFQTNSIEEIFHQS
jgi:uncharacterized protein (TIGR01777 family)